MAKKMTATASRPTILQPMKDDPTVYGCVLPVVVKGDANQAVCITILNEVGDVMTETEAQALDSSGLWIGLVPIEKSSSGQETFTIWVCYPKASQPCDSSFDPARCKSHLFQVNCLREIDPIRRLPSRK